MSSINPTNSNPPTYNSQPPSLWDQLVKKMNPKLCLESSMEFIEKEESLDSSMESILSDLSGNMERKKKKAMRRLYDLTDKKHRHNRTKLITKYKIHNNSLIPMLKIPEYTRLGCLILNNLTIPYENKAILLKSNSLLNELFHILENLKPETYLVCLILRNLSNIPDYHHRLINHSSGKSPLLKLLENMMVIFCPLVMQEEESNESFLRSSLLLMPIAKENKVKTNVKSTEFKALTYTILLLGNLSQTHASSVARHVKMIECVLELVQHLVVTIPLYEWTIDSLGDACLVMLLQLAKNENGRHVLKDDLYAPMYLMGLVGKGGIHDTRASWIQCCLEDP